VYLYNNPSLKRVLGYDPLEVSGHNAFPLVHPEDLEKAKAALFEAIDFDNGKIVNGRFSRYRVPRFSDVPSIETVLVDRKDLPSAGAGETPIVGLAPAVGNAIFEAVGIRLRSLPMAPNGLKL
jgi:isoquinoline 1-oxidoreductase